MFVLDEADELLSRGFNEQISDILTMLSRNIQFIVVSATMPCDLLKTTAKFMNDPVKIVIKREERTLEGIRQFYVNVEREVEIDIYLSLYDAELFLSRSGN
jgi:translation initiation factor 4A